MASKFWNPIYDGDDLPAEAYPKYLRRAIREKPAPVTQAAVEVENDDHDSEVHEADEDSDQDVPEGSAKQPISMTSNGRPRRSEYVEGGRPAYQKKVTRQLDSDDEMIMAMKKEGRGNDYIRATLINEGRTRYDLKSIATRHSRIKRFQQEYETVLLDEELTDWHVGDDEILKKAHLTSEKHYKAQLEKVHQNHWQYVADQVKEAMPRPRFSRNACRSRYEAIEAGTASMPPELDPDQEARQKQRAAMIEANAERRAARIAQEESVAKGRIERRDAAEQERIAACARRDERSALAAQRRAERDANKKDKPTLDRERATRLKAGRDERRAKIRAREEEKRVAAEALAAEKRRLRIERKVKQEERALLSDTLKRTKTAEKKLAEAAEVLRKQKAQEICETVVVECMAGKALDELEAGLVDTLFDEADAEAEISVDIPSEDVTRADLVDLPIEQPVTQPTPAQPTSKSATDFGLPENFKPAADPRFALQTNTLKAMCKSRGVPYSGGKADLVTSLASADSYIANAGLKDKLRKCGLTVTGTRKTWLKKLATNDAETGANSGSPKSINRKRKSEAAAAGEGLSKKISKGIAAS